MTTGSESSPASNPPELWPSTCPLNYCSRASPRVEIEPPGGQAALRSLPDLGGDLPGPGSGPGEASQELDTKESHQHTDRKPGLSSC